MIFEGDHSVIDALKEKKRRMATGEAHEHIRPQLVVSGGLLKGVYGLAALLALDDEGYREVFSSLVGVSSGAIGLAYFQSGQLPAATTLIRNQSILKKLIQPFSIFNVVNVLLLKDILRGKHNVPLKFDSSNTTFFVGVSEFETAHGFLYKPKQVEDLITAIGASVSMPGSVSHPSYLDGTRCVDGESTIPYVLSDITRVSKPTHILLVTNQDQDEIRLSFLDRFLTQVIYRWRLPRALRIAALQRRQTRRNWIQKQLDDGTTPLLVSWGDGSIASMDVRQSKIQATLRRQRAAWQKLLAN